MDESSPDLMIQLMGEAVAYSMAHVLEGGIPFSAFVVDEKGNILGQGVNRVREHSDPTAHAETEAIRDACRTHRTPHLRGLTLLASGEPCAMCYMNVLNSGVSRVFFAVDRDEAAAHGFDYRRTYTLFASDPRNWAFLDVRKLTVPDGMSPFRVFFQSLQSAP